MTLARASSWHRLGIAFVLCAVVVLTASGQERYLTTDAFLREVFADGAAEPHVLMIAGPLRTEVEAELGHAFGQARVRYWARNDRTAWIIDEIGKEQPITIGIAVDDGALDKVRVLEFRESRGSEVRYRFFTSQFDHARLGPDGELDKRIDGITGATLSVTAVTRAARLALVLDRNVRSH